MFEPMQIAYGDGTTVLTGAVRGQAQLHGLIGQIQELGLELVSAEQLDTPRRPGEVGEAAEDAR